MPRKVSLKTSQYGLGLRRVYDPFMLPGSQIDHGLITVDGNRGPHDLVVDKILNRLHEFGIGTTEDGTSRP